MLHRFDRESVPLKPLVSLSDQVILGVEGLVASHVGVAENLNELY